MLELLNRYSHGVALVPVVEALRRSSALASLPPGKSSSIGQLVKRHGLRPGYLAVALKMLCSLGWLRRDGDSVTVLDDRLERFSASCEGAAQALVLPYDDYVATGSQLSLAPWIERIEARWGGEGVIADCLDGVVLLPLLVTLIRGDHARAEPGRPGLALDLPRRQRAEVQRLFIGRGWAQRQGRKPAVTALGRFMLERGFNTAALLAYRPMLAASHTLLCGDPATVFGADEHGHERHVDRRLNVEGSGFQHGKFFAALDEAVVAVFDTEDLSAQPRFVADTGCGDGSLLRRIHDTVLSRTRRGRHLDSHPLRLVAIDFNPRALEVAAP